MTKAIKLHSVINAILPTRARLIGEGAGIIDLAVRFLLIEHPSKGIVLVDGGYGEGIRKLAGRKALLYRLALRPPREVITPRAALEHLGLLPNDIRHVVLTHLHADHVDNLEIAPEGAQLHVSVEVKDILDRHVADGIVPPLCSGDFPELVPPALIARAKPVEKAPLRYLEGGLRRFSGRDILGDGSILAFDLPGHARGQIGLAFPKVEGLDAPLIYGADASWTFEGIFRAGPVLAEKVMGADTSASKASRMLLASQASAGISFLLCHDDRRQPLDLALGKMV